MENVSYVEKGRVGEKMETTNILCEKKEQIMLNDLFEDFRVLLQDSDAAEEKEMVKNSLKKMPDNTTYLILGADRVGKTSLLNAVFQEKCVNIAGVSRN